MPFQMPEIRQSNALAMISNIRQQRTQNALAEREMAQRDRQFEMQNREFEAAQQTAAQERQRTALADVFNAVQQGKTPERAREIGASIMQSPQWQARFGQGGDTLAQQMLSQLDAWRPENIRAAAAQFGIRLRNDELADMAAEARVKRAPASPNFRVLRDPTQRYFRVNIDTGEREDLGFSGPTPPPAMGPAPANVTVLSGFTDPQGNPLVLDPRSNTVAPAGQGRVEPGAAPPQIKPAGGARDAATLRNEYLRETRDFRERFGAYQQIEALSGGGAVNDRALVIALMKVYDPTSVVREGEQAMMSNAGGAPEWARNTYNKILSGESLTPEQRAAMVQSARALVESQRPSYDATTSEYRRLAIEGGLEPSQVIVNTSGQATPAPGQLPRVRTEAEWRALPPGTPYIDPNGRPKVKGQ
jgi:hypothetical protein